MVYITDQDLVDWEHKFQTQVSDNIRHKATASKKLADLQLALDRAHKRIEERNALIRKLTPAGEKLAAEQEYRATDAERFLQRINELKDRIKVLETMGQRGQRATIESVIEWLKATAAQLPNSEES